MGMKTSSYFPFSLHLWSRDGCLDVWYLRDDVWQSDIFLGNEKTYRPITIGCEWVGERVGQ